MGDVQFSVWKFFLSWNKEYLVFIVMGFKVNFRVLGKVYLNSQLYR